VSPNEKNILPIDFVIHSSGIFTDMAVWQHPFIWFRHTFIIYLFFNQIAGQHEPECRIVFIRFLGFYY
jgi:hypothetical protein